MNFEEIYSDIILDYAKSTRFKRVIEGADHEHGHNTSCGDELELYFKVNDKNIIEDVSFDGHGCIISQASASMMCEVLKGKTIEQGEKIMEEVIKMSHGKPFDKELLEGIEIFEEISKYPMRVKCFTLTWHTFEEYTEKK